MFNSWSVISGLYVIIKPDLLVDTIDQCRQRALMKIITALHSTLGKYQGPDLTCTKRCDSMVLGSLTKAMSSTQMLIPPGAPYKGLSFDGLAQHVRAMEILTDSECEQIGNHGSPWKPRNSCQNTMARKPSDSEWASGGYAIHNNVKKDIVCVKESMECVLRKRKAKLCGLDLVLIDSK